MAEAVYEADCKSFSPEMAGTIAILQILNSLPANAQNVASLMHPTIDANAMTERVKVAIEELLKDQFVPLMEKDGSLRFFSEKLNDIEQERGRLNVRTLDFRRIFNNSLREVFDPLPTAKVHDLTLHHLRRPPSDWWPSRGAGGRARDDLDGRGICRTGRLRRAACAPAGRIRERANNTTIYLLGRAAPNASDLVTNIYRCDEIAKLYRNDPDQEVREYCASQTERAGKLIGELGKTLGGSLSQGSFLFRGRATAVDSLDPDLGKAARSHLTEAAAQVFDRYPEAPVRAETVLAEKFLRQPNLRSITSQLDPLSLVELGSSPKVRTAHKGPGQHPRLHRAQRCGGRQATAGNVLRSSIRLVARHTTLHGGCTPSRGRDQIEGRRP